MLHKVKASELKINKGTSISVPNLSEEVAAGLALEVVEDEEEVEGSGGIGSIHGSKVIPLTNGYVLPALRTCN